MDEYEQDLRVLEEKHQQGLGETNIVIVTSTYQTNEYENDLRCNEHFLGCSEDKARKIQACTGFEPITFAIPF